MKFDLEGGSKGVWFPFFGSKIVDGNVEYLKPEKDAGEVCVRMATAEILDKITTETQTRKEKFVYNEAARKMERVEYYTQSPEQKKEAQKMLWDFAIADWKSILDADDNDIPCTAENKLKLMNLPVFARFINRCIELLQLSEAERQEALEKN